MNNPVGQALLNQYVRYLYEWVYNGLSPEHLEAFVLDGVPPERLGALRSLREARVGQTVDCEAVTDEPCIVRVLRAVGADPALLQGDSETARLVLQVRFLRALFAPGQSARSRVWLVYLLQLLGLQ